MSTPLSPEVVPEIDADPLSLVYIPVIWYRISHIIGYSIACFSVSDIEMDKFCVWHRRAVHLTGTFQIAVHVNHFR